MIKNTKHKINHQNPQVLPYNNQNFFYFSQITSMSALYYLILEMHQDKHYSQNFQQAKFSTWRKVYILM